MKITYGYCHCGCGEKTVIAKQSRSERGQVKGCPIKYVNGHSNRKKDGLPVYRYKRIVKRGVHIDEHRLVMERHLGRSLTSAELVHHINGNTRDNHIANLKLMTRSCHARLHIYDSPIYRKGAGK